MKQLKSKDLKELREELKKESDEKENLKKVNATLMLQMANKDQELQSIKLQTAQILLKLASEK